MLLGGVTGLLLAVAVVYGAYAHYVNDIFQSCGVVILQIGVILGISFCTIPLSEEIFLVFGRWEHWYQERGKLAGTSEEQKGLSKYFAVFHRNPRLVFFAFWLIIFCAYIPIFLAMWPGNFFLDAVDQIKNAVDNNYSTHHPLIHTWLMGQAYLMGQRMGNVSEGYQFYTLLQMLVLSSSFAYCIYFIYTRIKARGMWLAVLLWFALFPMHARNAITATKDILCAAFFLYFVVFWVRLTLYKERFRWYSYAGMILTGTLAALFRNNMIYAIMAAAVVALIMVKGVREKGKILLICLTVFLLSHFSNEGMIRATNAREPDTYRESLSMPLQCLARVASYRRDELDDALYSEIRSYISMDPIYYNPYISDPMKNDANETLLRTNLVNFMKLWGKVGLQFPGEYLESIITNTMGYWFPINHGVYVYQVNDAALYKMSLNMDDNITWICYCKWADRLYSKILSPDVYYRIPLIGILFRCAPYFWIVMFYLFWGIYKKSRGGIAIGALLLCYLATCFLGPCTMVRYIYCIIVCVPLLLCLIPKGQSGDESIRK